MGQITIFTKDDCPYCVTVRLKLEKMMERVLLDLENRGCCDEKPNITIKEVNCTHSGALAALCIRLSGTFTVPHVFFNREYVGDANTFCCLDKETKNGCNILCEKLKQLACKPNPEPAFPPMPEAQVVKVTDDLAFCSQPTLEQIPNLRKVGIASVLNVLRADSPAYSLGEDAAAKDAGLFYAHSPILVVTAANLLRAVNALAAMVDKPVLVHDDIGSRAAIVVLLRAAQEMKEANGTTVTIAQFSEWCNGLGVPMAQVWLPEVTKALTAL